MKPTINLPANEKTFTITIEGETTKQPYTGKFRTVCVQNIGQRASADVLEKTLNSGLSTLTEETIAYHRVIAQLEHRLVAAPDWWMSSQNGRTLMDINVLWEVYKHCIEAEKGWREEIWGKPEEKKLANTTEEDQKTEEEPKA